MNRKVKDKLTIAICTPSFFPDIGGAEVTAHNLVLHLINKGHKVVVMVAFQYWIKSLRSGNNFGYRIIPLLPGHWRFSKCCPGWYRVLEFLYYLMLQSIFRFNVWQSFGLFPTGVSIARFVSRFGIPHVSRSVGYDIQVLPQIDYGLRLDPVVDFTINRWASKITRVIALTQSVTKDCRSVGFSEDQITVIPCAVDKDRFNQLGLCPKTIRKRHHIPEDPFTFITVGRNHPKKGFPYLLDAFAILKEKERDRDLHLVFLGDDTHFLKKQAQQLGIENEVTFIPHINPNYFDSHFVIPAGEVIEIYRCVDAFVFPSLIETFGGVHIEAMASGIPVITTDAEGCRDVVTHRENGLVSIAGDSNDLANQMDTLLKNETLRERLVGNALVEVQTKYSWDVVVGQYENLYKQITKA